MFEAERLAAKEQANYNKRTIGRCPRRKIKHRTAQDATNHARKIGDPGLNVYYCEGCAAWHTGHPRGRGRS